MHGLIQNQYLDDERQKMHEERCKIVNAVSRLSPDVRQLLLSNPEAVEKAVAYVVAAQKYNKNGILDPNHSANYDEWLLAEDAAIALLPKEKMEKNNG